ncbi:MAG TPA: acetylxylan esterase [Tepidisphaeraceae bacterium]|jgi:hypothetical protein|nr:acetylxylan esterase [Tepidisphaeraceae bacterium]
MRRTLAALLPLLVTCVCARADLKEILSESIIGPKQAMSDVQDYCEARIPSMPQVKGKEEWEALAKKMRTDALDKIVFRGEAAKWRDYRGKVQWTGDIVGGEGYTIRKVRYEAVPGMWIPAVLYVPDKIDGKAPGVLNVTGHDGGGKAVAYKQINCINQAKRGMFALNVEWFSFGQLAAPGFNHARMNQLDLCGTSGIAPFYLAMARGLDILESLDAVDKDRLAVTGLSGGGWQTIFISSLDERVKLSDPVAGYSSFKTRARFLSDLGDSEQTPCDLGTVADYMHLTAMRAPRPTLLTFNSKDDCCFASGHALAPLMEAARPIFALYGAENALRSHVNDVPGTHNYEKENREEFYKIVADFFFTGKQVDYHEIECASELKTKEQLAVELPAENESFHSLAMKLSKDLPRQSKGGGDRADRLKQLVAWKDLKVSAESAGVEEKDGTSIHRWKLRMGDAWSVPCVELSRAGAKGTVIVVHDGGRKAASEQVSKILAEGKRVLAIDPFYFGESRIEQRDYLFALLMLTIGDRPLGLQASQVAASARWIADKYKGEEVGLMAVGPRSTTFALIAAALEPSIAQVDLNQPLTSLRDVIEKDWTMDKTPEMFCFGLLAEFDLKDIETMIAPRKVTRN